MFCSSCGKSIPDDSSFCPECGVVLVTPPPYAASPLSAPEGVSNSLFWGIIIATVFIPLVGIIYGLINMNTKDQAKRKAGKVWLLVGLGCMVVYAIATLSR